MDDTKLDLTKRLTRLESILIADAMVYRESMTQTILIIEDEAQTRTLFQRCLSFENFQAIEASCGSEGIRLAQQYSPDLIVCDIMMPDMDGYQVLATLRKISHTSSIPFIFLTAKVTMADLRIGMDLGADDYLTKPCTIEQFLAAIHTRLQRHADLSTAKPIPDQQNDTASPSHSIVQTSLTQTIDRIFPDCPQLSDVFQYIDHHYRQPIRLHDVAEFAGYSPAYLTSLVHAQTGRSIKQWIIERRMIQARELLARTQETVQKIALNTGYNDTGYFIRQFRQHHGTSPQAWRTDRKKVP